MKVITLLGVTAIALYLSSCSTRTVELPEGYIGKDTANKMIESYLTSIAGDTADLPAPTLNSLIMDADLLRNYLSNQEIKKVKVMFAHRLDYINSGHAGQNVGLRSDALTIILAGYNKEGNYIFAPGRMVPNHATPCPRNCPDFGSASNNLLQ
ncbi:hypothetical protein [Taibaiella soli]|uniref:Uncharacterized protein n=1 Tax=Taibaiella soli TaxID=1649169 RepID=A0A2W2AV61_9BACT|nr:hypothetical protein [Taibaiella soli]PZF71578.1 hypothetical protein DN068_16010 [Taibaiella soli]